MAHDKNTLDGSLLELAELIETNLNLKYVDDARASDKLTTLARKILRTRSRRIIIWTSAGNSVEPDLEYISGNPGVFDIYVLVLGENEEPVVNHSVDLTVRFLRDLDNDEITEIMTDMGSVIDSNVDDRTFDLISCTTNQYGFATFQWKAFAHGNFVLDASSTVESRLLHETYEVNDYEWFDNATKNMASSYTSKQLGTDYIPCSISYSNEYLISTTSSIIGWFGMSPPVSLSTSENWVVETKSKANYKYFGLTIGDGVDKHICMVGYPIRETWGVYGYVQPNAWIIPERGALISPGNYYTQKVSLINGTLHYELYDDNGTLLDSANTSLPTAYENTIIYPCVSSWGNADDNRKVFFKKFTVKKL